MLLLNKQTDRHNCVKSHTNIAMPQTGYQRQIILYNNTAGRLEECTARQIDVGYCSTARYDGGKSRAQLSLRRAFSAHRFSNEDDAATSA